ncbi:hypothetical protein SAMN05519105_1066 [Rhodobacter sp. 24-YEA-8]|nr:hypothetical protein SAMN05519105_1066 [Rhodobacter sp. 24-YEA-8]
MGDGETPDFAGALAALDPCQQFVTGECGLGALLLPAVVRGAEAGECVIPEERGVMIVGQIVVYD